ncbi:MAG: hypothetical protein ACYCSO_02205 [Cuniculiplasma sp.]
MGTRSQGNAGNYLGRRDTSKEISALRKAIDAHLDAKTLANMAIKTLAISNPFVGEVVLGAKLAYSAYKGLKTYRETGDLKQALLSAGVETTKTFAEEFLLPGSIKTASNLIVPGLVVKFAGNGANQVKIRDDTKIIKSAIEGAAGVLT